MLPNKQTNPARANPARRKPPSLTTPPRLSPKRPGKLLRLPAVEERTGFKKSSIYAGLKTCTFPAPYRLSARAVGWREEDLDKWVSERVKVGVVGAD